MTLTHQKISYAKDIENYKAHLHTTTNTQKIPPSPVSILSTVVLTAVKYIFNA
jgi:hypothetical protein